MFEFFNAFLNDANVFIDTIIVLVIIGVAAWMFVTAIRN